MISVGQSDCSNALQILATFTNGSLTQLPNQIAIQRSGLREVNKRIRQAMEIRSSERMRKEHITAFTQVFKDSHMEGKVRTSLVGEGSCEVHLVSAARAQWTLIGVSLFLQYSQMRDELFKSNMVCSFILLVLLMVVQVLVPAPR